MKKDIDKKKIAEIILSIILIITEGLFLTAALTKIATFGIIGIVCFIISFICLGFVIDPDS